MDLYTEKDFVEVVDGDGNPIEGFASPVPKAWVGTDLLPPGAKAKSGRGGKSTSSAGDKTESEDS